MTPAAEAFDAKIKASISPGGEEYEAAARALKATIYMAEMFGHDSIRAKGAAARYGQLISRTWKCKLVAMLTDFATEGQDGATRERVREWQQATFGRSVASRFLTKWAQPGAGSRGQDDFLDPVRSMEVGLLWERHNEGLRTAMERLKESIDAERYPKADLFSGVALGALPA